MDPISAQLTKGALKQVATPDTLGPQQQKNFSVDQSSFGNLLSNHMDSSSNSTGKMLEMVDNMMGGTGQDMKAIPAGEINVDLAKVGEVKGSGSSSSGNVSDIFKEINSSQNNMDSLMEQMNSGKKFSTNELMRLQIFAHQHTVTYELVSKFGEMANRAVQTPFQMQV